MTQMAGPATMQETRPGMAWVPGGSFLMGSDDFYPEESPPRRVEVGGFWFDERPVTVAGSGASSRRRNTHGRRAPARSRGLPGRRPGGLVPGSLVFRPTAGPVDLRDFRSWWAYVPGRAGTGRRGPGATRTRVRATR